MKKENRILIREGDYILLTTDSNITFAGIVEKIEEDQGRQMIVFRPSAEAPLFITIDRSFIKRIKVLIPKGEQV